MLKLDDRKKPLLLIIILIAASLFAFGRTLNYGFIDWDDDINVFNNPVFLQPAPLKNIWFSLKTPSYLPMTYTLFYTEWILSNGDPRFFHFMSVFLHILNALLLFYVLKRAKLESLPAFFAALLYSLHPMRVESVAWISEQKSLLSGVFIWLCFLSFIRYSENNRALFFFSTAACYLLAILSKQTALPLLFIIPAFNYFILMNRSFKEYLKIGAVLGGSGALILALTWARESRHFAATLAESLTFPQRIIIFGKSLTYYILRTLYPFDLSPVYPRWTLDTGSFFNFLPLALILGLALITAYIYKSRKDELGSWTAFCSLSYFLSILPVSGLISMPYLNISFIADRYSYLPGVFLIILFVLLVKNLAKKWAVILAALAALLLYLSFSYAHIYSGSYVFWSHVLERDPASKSAHSNLGYYLMHKPEATRKDLMRALSHHQKVMTLDPLDPMGYYNYGVCLFKLGDLSGAERYLRKALELRPGQTDALNDLGYILERQGKRPQAIECYRAALKIDPRHYLARRNLSRLLGR